MINTVYVCELRLVVVTVALGAHDTPTHLPGGALAKTPVSSRDTLHCCQSRRRRCTLRRPRTSRNTLLWIWLWPSIRPHQTQSCSGQTCSWSWGEVAVLVVVAQAQRRRTWFLSLCFEPQMTAKQEIRPRALRKARRRRCECQHSQ
jgi:hypothetical protein